MNEGQILAAGVVIVSVYGVGWLRGRYAGMQELDWEWLKWLVAHPYTVPASAECWYTHPRAEGRFWWWKGTNHPKPRGKAESEGEVKPQ